MRSISVFQVRDENQSEYFGPLLWPINILWVHYPQDYSTVSLWVKTQHTASALNIIEPYIATYPLTINP